MRKKLLLIGLLTILKFFSAAAQQVDEIAVANEYYANGEVDKAKDSFEKLARKNENLSLVYKNYLSLLLEMKNFSEAEKFSKKASKAQPQNILYKLDHYQIVKEYLADKKTAEKEFVEILAYLRTSPEEVSKTASYLAHQQLWDEAMRVYVAARKNSGNNYLYINEVSTLYLAQKKYEELTIELISYVEYAPQYVDDVKNMLQIPIQDAAVFDMLETKLYEKIQSNPDKIVFNELVLWMAVQQKRFTKALIQAKAIDRRNRTEGQKLLEIGKIAYSNKVYDDAIKFFEAIISEYKDSRQYAPARKLLINAKEEQVKNTFPINYTNIHSLVNDYKNLIIELGKGPQTSEPLRNMALLEAFYLNNLDTAVVLLTEAIATVGANQKEKDKAKLDLGDIYILKGEPWESTLLYYQVEKTQKEDPLGHEAKLRNAKLSYYKGEFGLAQEHLDVLKMATSREISNDAIYLSILIKDNLAFDSTGEALSAYSKVELLIFQNKYNVALDSLLALQVRYSNHALADDILFLEAKIHRKLGQTDKSLLALEALNQKHGQDILGDDALYLYGNILEEDLKNTSKAMEVYQDFLIKFPGSIYSVEARKRFRTLRGDKL